MRVFNLNNYVTIEGVSSGNPNDFIAEINNDLISIYNTHKSLYETFEVIYTDYKDINNGSFNSALEVKAYLDDIFVSNNVVQVESQPPFAKPDYRTKMAATNSWVSCALNDSTEIDYQIIEERYISGGEINYKNAEEGDYITAEIFDKDNVIPLEYRASLCENHPTVAIYIEKKWIIPESGYGKIKINTYPLNAKVTPGLYLRVTYHAVNSGVARNVSVDYHLSKRLV